MGENWKKKVQAISRPFSRLMTFSWCSPFAESSLPRCICGIVILTSESQSSSTTLAMSTSESAGPVSALFWSITVIFGHHGQELGIAWRQRGVCALTYCVRHDLGDFLFPRSGYGGTVIEPLLTPFCLWSTSVGHFRMRKAVHGWEEVGSGFWIWIVLGSKIAAGFK